MIKLHTLYICMLLSGFVSAQKPLLSYYQIRDTVSQDTIHISLNYWEKFNTGEGNPIRKVKEYFKDSLFKDSVITTIRKFPMDYQSSHGGSYDYYYGKMKSGRYSRSHDYGSSAYDGRYDDDVYMKDGKYIALIRAEFLPDNPKKPEYLILVIQRFQIASVFDTN